MSSSRFASSIQLLSAAQVEYIIIGGLAGIVQGSALLTYDVDICYQRTRQNVERLCAALQNVHPALRDAPGELPFRFDVSTIMTGMNFTLDTDLGPLDLMGEVIPFGPYENVLNHSETAELFGYQVRVLTLEGLIATKRATGRRKDLLVLPELEALLEMRNRPNPS